MGNIKIGNLSIDKAFFGNLPVEKMYYGNILIWEKAIQANYLAIKNNTTTQGYFYVNVLDSFSGTLPNLEYKIDNGQWQTYNIVINDGVNTVPKISVDGQSTIYLRGNNPNGFITDYGKIFLAWENTNSQIVSGNPISLMDNLGTGNLAISSRGFYNLFFPGDDNQYRWYIVINTNKLFTSTLLDSYAYSNMFGYGAGANSTFYTCINSQSTIPEQKVEASVIPQSCFNNVFAGYQGSNPIVLDLTNAVSVAANSLYLTRGFNQNSQMVWHFKFGKNLSSLASGYYNGSGVTDHARNLIFTFEHSSSDAVLFDTNNIIVQQTSNKYIDVVTVYTDNTTIKDACLAKANSYTTVNVYHLDGTSWGL